MAKKTRKSPASKPHHITVMKQKAADYDKLAVEFEKLKARLDAAENDMQAPAIAVDAPVRVSDIEIPEGFPSDWDGYAYLKDRDELRWINERSTVQVHLVSQNSAILRLPSGTNAKLGRTWGKSYQSTNSCRRWKHRHIIYRGRTEDETRQNERNNQNWWHHDITVDDALVAFPDGHPTRNPNEGIIYPELFKGISHRGRLLGPRTEASGDKLREYVRLLLQFGCREMTYLNLDFPVMREQPLIKQEKPNPYEFKGGGTVRSLIQVSYMPAAIS